MFHLYAYSLQILSYVLYFSFLFPAFLFKFPLEIPPGCLSQYVWNWTYRIPLLYKLISLIPLHLPTAQDWKPESLSAVSSTKTQQFSIVNTMGALPSPIFLFIHSLLKGLLYSSTVLEKMRTNEWVKYQALWSLTYQKSGWWMDRSLGAWIKDSSCFGSTYLLRGHLGNLPATYLFWSLPCCLSLSLKFELDSVTLLTKTPPWVPIAQDKHQMSWPYL